MKNIYTQSDCWGYKNEILKNRQKQTAKIVKTRQISIFAYICIDYLILWSYSLTRAINDFPDAETGKL
ncbi:MAG: hypothetical protein HFI10_07825 [Lachnospiraceae bacterium]|jgi:hypothetical protein|nr:hypothetical protein [Lachnospiraceae bacterium]